MKRIIAAGLAGLALVSFSGLVAAATQLLVPLDSGIARAKALGDVPMRFNREGLERLQPGADVELTLPNGSRHDYVYEQIIDHGGGFKTWIARSPLTGAGERAVITYGPNGSWGWMRTRYGDYRIYPSNKGYDLVAKREPQMLAPKWKGGDAVQVADDPPEIAPLKGTPTLVEPSFKSTLPKALPGPAVQSDLMLIYTKDLADKLGVGLMPMLLNLVASVNQAYVDSEVSIVLRLVNATMIDHSNAHASDDTLDGMGGFGAFASTFQPLTWGVSSVRNTVGADFVALLRDGPTDTGGIGNLNRNPVIYPDSTAGQTSGYSVNNFCASGCEGILAHELGHNMGSHHDPATIAYDVGGTFNPASPSHQGVFPYSYGYYSCNNGLTCNPFSPSGGCTEYATCTPNSVGPPVVTNPNDFGTIMSYFNPRVMKFSNPLLSNCEPAGAPGSPRACGGAVPAPPAPGGVVSDNAQSLNHVRGALSAYRNQTITNLAGAVQFTNTTYSGAEGTNLTFTVSRTNGSSGSLTVSYAVTGGSATAGTDFTAASGTLSWANGDTANKSFNVTLKTDALVEGIETLTATLSAPTGGVGAYIGYPNAAIGLILEPWPLGTLGGLPTDPTGWSTPASPASSVAWAIANDSAAPGDPDGRSLKSGALNHSVQNCNDGSTPVACPSAVQLTRNFSAGTVSFAYRVSTVAFFGFFEFLIDGNVVFSTDGDASNAANGGDTGWKNFSTNLTAGTHTLKWQFRTRLPDACGNFLIGGVDYPGCQDRAWIDQLALPAAQANPPRLGNISTRMQVLTGNDVMIGGFVIGGSKNKTVAIVATGPSLVPFGITNALANPTLRLVRSSDQATIASNDDWQTAANQAALSLAGFAPTNPFEAAILIDLAPGAYTAIVEGAGGGTGVSVIGVYEVSGPDIPLVNISTRGRVLTGNDVMIGGFVIGGSGNKTLAIVATGPSLVPFGITNALANPTLRLVRSSDQATIASNDDWQTAANQAALSLAGFAPSNPLEAAILVDLAPGAYTAIVEGAGGGTGVSVIGVYEVSAPDIPLINISTRGRVLTGNDVMIGGFVIQGTGPQTLAIVATGPSLIPFGITSALANPTIRLVRSSDQATLATNDNWQTDPNAALLQGAGFAPTDPLESGLYTTLPPGAYTVIVEGAGGGTGVAVIGVYKVN
jgi:hypothetical protein